MIPEQPTIDRASITREHSPFDHAILCYMGDPTRDDPQWELNGEWSEEELALIEPILIKHMGPWYSNRFIFHRTEWSDGTTHYLGWKPSWESNSIGGATIEDLVQGLRNYFKD